jgi:hypothetical protein
MSIKRLQEIDITPREAAEEFCAWGEDDQVAFFKFVGRALTPNIRELIGRIYPAATEQGKE